MSPKVMYKKQQRRKKTKNLIFSVLLGLLLAIILVFLTHIRIHRVVGESMAPAIGDKEWTIVNKVNVIEVNDIIVFRPPRSICKQNEKWVKRVVGLPGETIIIQGDELMVSSADGRSIRIIHLEQKLEKQDVFEGEIPKNKYFVLGDNQKNSIDSRKFGLIRKKSIEGKVIWENR